MRALTEGWEVASCPPGSYEAPSDLPDLPWVSATVPGTAAGAVGADERDFDAEDWWFRCHFALDEPRLDDERELVLDGIATISQVYFNGQLVLESESMWLAHRVDVGELLCPDNELVIVCRALTPLLAKRRRPSPRWRTRVVNAANLRWYRTMMFGRSPGFAPGPAAVGPWRPVYLRRPPVLDELSIQARLDGRDGVVSVRGRPRDGVGGLTAAVGNQRQPFSLTEDGVGEAELRLADAELWWPHTHGDPTLYPLSIEYDGRPEVQRRVGFRRLRWAEDPLQDGLDLTLNDVPIFARGAVWTPADLISLAPEEPLLRRLLESVRDAGMNMLRVVGTGAYESPTFHDLCDELGIMVWQDLMFANLDYPAGDAGFRAMAVREAEQVLSGLTGRPSLTVVCGNSEVEQQPAMMGLDPELGRSDLWEGLLAEVAGRHNPECAYLRSTPCGGDLPFHADRGVTHYFGVTGYFRPPEDARRANVRFASESLAFANVPDEVSVPVHHPGWKVGVQRDAGTGWDLGAGWDFDDVRDFYLRLLYGVDPVQLRRSDHERYLELSRAASGEVMAEVMGEWRREQSTCKGALVLWLKDMLPGAGLGVLDHRGAPKVAYHYLRRALAPAAVWMTDEGVNGVAIHVANDGPGELPARLRVALYRGHRSQVAEAEIQCDLKPYGVRRLTVEGLIGHYVDAAWAYRFGPPAQDVIVASLTSGEEPDGLLSQAFHFPAGRPGERLSAEDIGLEARWEDGGGHGGRVRVTAAGLAYAVKLRLPGLQPGDDAFSIEPGGVRTVGVRSDQPGASFTGGHVTALNMSGTIRVQAAS